MKNKKKIFSIVTPTLNSKKFISKTIHSIHRQTFKNFEHIIVDGRSTDGTLKMMKLVSPTLTVALKFVVKLYHLVTIIHFSKIKNLI